MSFDMPLYAYDLMLLACCSGLLCNVACLVVCYTTVSPPLLFRRLTPYTTYPRPATHIHIHPVCLAGRRRPRVNNTWS